MQRQVEIVPEPRRREGGHVVLAAAFRDPGRRPLRLWFRVPAACEPWLTDWADPFATAFVFEAALRGRPVIVRGKVSPSLLRGLGEFTRLWASWRPRIYRAVDLSADDPVECPAAPAPARAICTFSGGLDSCYTVYRHRKGLAGDRAADLTTAIFVHGFDVPLRDTDGYRLAFARNERMAGSVGVELLPVATNFRGLMDGDWEDTYGTAPVAVLSLFKGGFARGMMASSFSIRTLPTVWGSMPRFDPMLSAEGFPMSTDGIEVARLGKMRAIVSWPEAMEGLRVCWQGRPRHENCCRCEKCIRTMLLFRVIGRALPPCFPRDVTDARIRSMVFQSRGGLLGFAALRDAVREAGLGDTSWARAMDAPLGRQWLARILGTLRHAWLRPRCLAPLRRRVRAWQGW